MRIGLNLAIVTSEITTHFSDTQKPLTEPQSPTSEQNAPQPFQLVATLPWTQVKSAQVALGAQQSQTSQLSHPQTSEMVLT